MYRLLYCVITLKSSDLVAGEMTLVKSTCSSCRRLRFGSQHSHSSLVTRDWMPSRLLQVLGTCVVYIHAGITYTHTIKIHLNCLCNTHNNVYDYVASTETT